MREGRPPAQIERRIDQDLAAQRRCELALGFVQGDGCEPATGAVADDRQPPRIEAERTRFMRQPRKRGDAVLNRGREGVLGREAIVEREDGRAGVVAKRAAEYVMRVDVAEDTAAAMDEKDRRAVAARCGIVSAQTYRSGGARCGEIARHGDRRRRDLGLGQAPAILLARGLRRESPKRRRVRG